MKPAAPSDQVDTTLWELYRRGEFTHSDQPEGTMVFTPAISLSQGHRYRRMGASRRRLFSLNKGMGARKRRTQARGLFRPTIRHRRDAALS